MVCAIIIALACVLCITSVRGETDEEIGVMLKHPTKIEVKSHLMTKNGLFESDLKLSEETILRNYDFSSVPGGEELREEIIKTLVNHVNSGSGDSDFVRDTKLDRKTRAVNSDSGLWSDHTVWYAISPSISSNTSQVIRHAMNHWEENTCLQFLERSEENDYVMFDNSQTGCYSTSVGRSGGMQTINLEAGTECENFGVIVHEIGHVIGFWHEQSRPDRDNYVTINWDNIRDDAFSQYQFLKRNDLQIDYQGSGYDYSSIMHSDSCYFLRDPLQCPNNVTIDVNDPEEYTRQSSPIVGQRNSLSTSDIEQANRLYSCPNSGVQGLLYVKVIQGYSLPDTDDESFWDDPDPYIRLTFVDSNGNIFYDQTSIQFNTRSPEWNERIAMEEREWQFFRVRAFDQDLGSDDDAMSMSKTVLVETGTHNNLTFCIDTNCAGNVTFEYELIPLYIHSRLQVTAHFAYGVPFGNFYVQVDAMKSTTDLQTHSTTVLINTPFPVWIETLDFGCDKWALIDIQLWDQQVGGDNEISAKETVILQPGSYNHQKHNFSGQGQLIYEYHLTPQLPCSSNLCQNGGSCNDLGCDYSCSCPAGYYGSHCEFTPCTSNPCQNGGTCAPINDSYSCSCPAGYYGTQCQNTPCSSISCQNGGTCVIDGSSFRCICPPGYSGTYCQITPCSSRPCQNGGTCIVHGSSFRCICRPGYSGTYCQITPCSSHSCRNGGTCIIYYDSYRCICPPGYSGTYCQITPCTSNCCGSGGTCVISGSTKYCSCHSGYSGTCCTTFRGNLRVYVRYGRDLPDEDPTWNDSDPFVKVYAYDSNGNSVVKQTGYVSGNQNPDWNQWLHFGTRTWSRFHVKVYDYDPDSSNEALSGWGQWNLPSSARTSQYVRYNCNSGYIKFDYYYE